MTEVGWFTSNAPDEMLKAVQPGFLSRLFAGRKHRRKLGLFAIASLRRIWQLLPEGCRQCIDISERYADGGSVADDILATALAGEHEVLTHATDQVHAVGVGCEISKRVLGELNERQAAAFMLFAAAFAVFRCTLAVVPLGVRGRLKGMPEMVVAQAARAAVAAASYNSFEREWWRPAWKGEEESQANILRDIFGNPFRRLKVEPSWLTWNDGTIVKAATAAYEERALPSGHLDNGRLAVLADMLEEAGATDAQILEHLRRPEAVHVRGCWVVDLLLGKM